MKRLLRLLGPIIGVSLFVLSLYALHRILKEYHYSDVLMEIRTLAPGQVLSAILFTALSYLSLTGYEVLALRYIRHPLPYRKVALASFISHSFANNIGLAWLTGGSVRYRLYGAWGLTTVEVAQVVAFSGITIWLGYFTVSGLAFLFVPLQLPSFPSMPGITDRPIGILFLICVGLYLAWSAMRRQPLRIRNWEIQVPTPGLTIAQTIIASLDWCFAAAALYVLFPDKPGLSFFPALGVILLAHFLGMVSQVPGGLGVFESVILLFFTPDLSASSVMGALVLYRAVYYVLPLSLAAILLGAHEAFLARYGVRRVAQLFSPWLPGLIPPIFSFITFLGGAILLFSGATPAASGRLKILKDLIPLPLVEVSHFLGSLTGAGLLLLAQGLQRRLDAAWFFTVFLYSAGIAFSLIKGFDYEEALLLAILLTILLPCRKHFYRQASLFGERFTLGWTAAIIMVLLCACWLGLFAYKHVEYSNELWWKFSFSRSGEASRFLRATVGAAGFALCMAIWRLIRPAQPRYGTPDSEVMKRVRVIVSQSEVTTAKLALLGDKDFLFDDTNSAFIMYGIEGRSWISMGDPVGPVKIWPELLWRFREISDRNNGWPVFFQISHRNLALYIDLGLSFLKLGEEAIIPLDTFSLEGGARKNLRYTYRKLQKEGCQFEIVPSENVPSILSDLKRVSEAWLKGKNAREKKFSLGFFSEDYLRMFPVATIRWNNRIIAFANLWLSSNKNEISIDLMRHFPDNSPDGVMEYLFIELLLWGKSQNFNRFNMGMAPLSGIEDRALAPLWNRLGSQIFQHGEHFYNFQGLRHYKEKFDPVWEPRYLASPGGFILPRIMTNITTLIAGGVRGIVAK